MPNILRLTQSELMEFVSKAGPEQEWILDTETDGLNVVGPLAEHGAWWIGLSPKGTESVCVISRGEYDDWGLGQCFQELNLIGHNLRFDLHALNLTPMRPWQDTMVAAYYGHTSGKRSMDHIASVNGWNNIPTPAALKEGRIADIPDAELFAYLANDCIVTSKMVKRMNMTICAFDYRVEQAAYGMECRGVRLLDQRFDKVADQLNGLIDAQLETLRAKGLKGNLDSPIQVANWLLEHGRKLPLTKAGKPSTAKLALQQLADKGDTLATHILDYRKVMKLKTSFIEPLPRMTQAGILYPRTNTTKTRTGRFSCDSPNLQQIPKRGPLGKAIRQCLTSPNNEGVTACDFSQVELRVAAALANEPVLLEAFAQGRCPHTEVAAKMVGKSVTKVTAEERFKAKAVNFGILNGMGVNRLAIELKSNRTTAAQFLSDYRNNLFRLNYWMEKVWREAAAYRVARTVAGRTRIFTSKDDTRPAVSVVVQGTAAELMRHSLVAVHEADLCPLLSVHDEILIPGTCVKQAEKLQEVMESAANGAYPSDLGSVQFTAKASLGETWGDT